MVDAKDELCRIDAAAGDGDLGLSVAAGFEAMREAVDQYRGRDLGECLSSLGLRFANAAPGSYGILFGSALARAGMALRGCTALTQTAVQRALVAMADAVQSRGKAEPGDKTLLDALRASQAAVAALPVEDSDLVWLFGVAAASAAQETERLASQPARAGRARALGKRTAGMTAWVMFCRALADAIQDSAIHRLGR
jgi:dihydroxyacetone kinase-like protein